MDNQIAVLDKGFVYLVDVMPANRDGDKAIVQAARVSYAGDTTRKRSDAGLIRYLVENRHTSPLEMVVFKFHVKLPISVARQWQRHRTQSYNEVSTRYSKVKDGEFYIPVPGRIRAQDGKNRQASGEQVTPVIARATVAAMQEAHQNAQAVYQDLMALGVSRETARGVLPLDTYTEFYTKVDLHNLFGFLTLRLGRHAQWEIRQYAKALYELAQPLAPVAFAAWSQREGISS